MIEYLDGDILKSSARTLVNPVNTVGVMGAGLARDFAIAFPDMARRYRDLCQQGLLHIGTLWTWRGKVLCFPTKKDWRDPSKLSYIEAGLANLAHSYKERGITSIAIPRLGCGLGGLDWELVRALIEEYLGPTNLDVQIYTGEPGESAEPELE